LSIPKKKGQDVRTTFQLRITPEERAEIERGAALEGLSMSAFVRRIIILYIRELATNRGAKK
jgi:uncharacterized protein (DUF1778 family)